MNMGATPAVYVTLCRETERPLPCAGSTAQGNGLMC